MTDCVFVSFKAFVPFCLEYFITSIRLDSLLFSFSPFLFPFPSLSHQADETCLWEVGVLSSHVHPTLAHVARGLGDAVQVNDVFCFGFLEVGGFWVSLWCDVWV